MISRKVFGPEMKLDSRGLKLQSAENDVVEKEV
jgi:hypothetical protein